jgi:hypothetical protein
LVVLAMNYKSCLKVGLKSYCTDVYVSPIDDDMLLVLDFLKRHQTITDLKNNTFTIGDDQIPLYCGSQNVRLSSA